MYNTKKCAALSVVLTAVTVLQAVIDPVFKLMQPLIYENIGGEALIDYLKYPMKLIMWISAVIIVYLGFIATVTFFRCSSNEHLNYAKRLMKFIIVVSAVSFMLSTVVSSVFMLISLFLFTGSCILMILPQFVMSGAAIFFAAVISMLK